MAEDDIASNRARAPSGAKPTASHGRAEFVALKSGLPIRQYVIEEVIGAGGFGITYRARHATLRAKIFALKEYFPRDFAARSGTHVLSTADGDGLFRWGLDRFLEEAEALAACHHPAIVDVVDYFAENGTAYAVLGYVEGQQLGQWLASLGRPPSQAEIDRVALPLLDALEVVHAANLLHRDIAPDNILIRTNGAPCLIDFGACREDIRERSRKVSAIVKHGYSPPEQYHGIAELQGPWTDIYAMGATLYRAISGETPMDSSRRGALGDTLKPIREMTETAYRPGFMSAIDMSLRLQPDERPRSVAEWREMLTSPDSAPVAQRQGNSASGNAGNGQILASAAEPTNGGVDRTVDPSTINDPGPGKGAPASVGHTAAGQAAAAPATKGSRKPLLVAGAGIALIGGMAALALLRSPQAPSPPPSPPATITQNTTTQIKPAPVTTPLASTSTTPGVTSTSPQPERQPPQSDPQIRPQPDAPPARDTRAESAAWTRVADSRDSAALQRFLDDHGQSEFAGAARARLAALREDAARTERDRRATADWARLANSNDVAAIERFLAEHGTSAAATEARTRLAVLGLEAGQVREREAAFEACRTATDAQKAAACRLVIDSDDTPARRATALHARALAARKLGNYDAAIADFTQWFAVSPVNAAATTRAAVQNDRGIAHFLKGDGPAAIRDYGEAIRLDPNHAEAFNNRAWAVFQEGRAADALPDANRSVEIAPTNGYAYDTRAHILEVLGRRDDAIRDYQRAITLDPDQGSSRAALARLRGAR